MPRLVRGILTDCARHSDCGGEEETKEVAMTLLYTDPLFLQHDTGRHVETADRLRSITARLEKTGLVKKCTAGTYKPLTEEAVAKLHAAKQVQQVKQVAAHGGGRLDPDPDVRPDSSAAALARRR